MGCEQQRHSLHGQRLSCCHLLVVQASGLLSQMNQQLLKLRDKGQHVYVQLTCPVLDAPETAPAVAAMATEVAPAFAAQHEQQGQQQWQDQNWQHTAAAGQVPALPSPPGTPDRAAKLDWAAEQVDMQNQQAGQQMAPQVASQEGLVALRARQQQQQQADVMPGQQAPSTSGATAGDTGDPAAALSSAPPGASSSEAGGMVAAAMEPSSSIGADTAGGVAAGAPAGANNSSSHSLAEVPRDVALMVPLIQRELLATGMGLPGNLPIKLPKQACWGCILYMLGAYTPDPSLLRTIVRALHAATSLPASSSHMRRCNLPICVSGRSQPPPGP